MKTAFTLIEVLVIIGLIIILTGLAVPVFQVFQKESVLNNSTQEIINALRLAQNKTAASEGASSWGVYFEDITSPHQYTLFKGGSYALRDSSFDEIHKLSQLLEIYEIDLQGAGSEIVFNRVEGTTGQFGKLSLRLKSEPVKTKTIYIENSGQVGLTAPLVPSDSSRIKDSRHIHFDYSQPIDTVTEKLTLTLDVATTKEIIIAENLKDGQIYWEGEVDVGGEIQKLKIHTHRLNDAVLGSQFSIHRDKRYNNKSLKIEISGDSGSDLIRYDADGQTTKGNSIYVSEPDWQ